MKVLDEGVLRAIEDRFDIAPLRRVRVIPTNEELLIARDTFRIVRGLPLT